MNLNVENGVFLGFISEKLGIQEIGFKLEVNGLCKNRVQERNRDPSVMKGSEDDTL